MWSSRCNSAARIGSPFLVSQPRRTEWRRQNRERRCRFVGLWFQRRRVWRWDLVWQWGLRYCTMRGGCQRLRRPLLMIWYDDYDRCAVKMSAKWLVDTSNEETTVHRKAHHYTHDENTPQGWYHNRNFQRTVERTILQLPSILSIGSG